MNTNLRKTAKNDVEKDVFNENIPNIEICLVTTERKKNRLMSVQN